MSEGHRSEAYGLSAFDRKSFGRAKHAVLDLLYPRSCIGCGTASPQTFNYICWDCWSDVNKVEPPFCSLCGDPVAGAVDHGFICYACSANTPAFDGARSAVRYGGVAGEALRLLKYEKALWLVPDIAQLMRNCLQGEYPDRKYDLITPVPLFRVRRREREYNQSAVLASAVGRLLGVKSVPQVLRRIRPTATQTNLTAPQRLSNVHNAFESKREKLLAGKQVLLVDDVMTTGATVNACAKALKKGGAVSVTVLTAARG